MGATVSRIRIELIFHRCWNLIIPCGQHGTAGGAGAIALIPATGQIIKRPVLNLGRAVHDLAQSPFWFFADRRGMRPPDELPPGKDEPSLKSWRLERVGSSKSTQQSCARSSRSSANGSIRPRHRLAHALAPIDRHMKPAGAGLSHDRFAAQCIAEFVGLSGELAATRYSMSWDLDEQDMRG